MEGLHFFPGTQFHKHNFENVSNSFQREIGGGVCGMVMFSLFSFSRCEKSDKSQEGPIKSFCCCHLKSILEKTDRCFFAFLSL